MFDPSLQLQCKQYLHRSFNTKLENPFLHRSLSRSVRTVLVRCAHGPPWLKERGLGLPEGRVTFTKDTLRLVVYEYRFANGTPIFGVLMIDDSLPKTIARAGVVVQQGQSRIREFRELKEDLPTIFAKAAE